MRYVDELVNVSNDEELFKQELQKIKKQLQESPNLNKETKLFVNNLNKYCLKYKEEFSDKDAYILPIDNYCMFVLNNAFDYIKTQSKTSEEVFKERCGLRNTPKHYKDLYNNDYISAILESMDLSFWGEECFKFNKLENIHYYDTFKNFITNFDLNIINELIGIKPTIFIGENHYIKNSPLTDLGLGIAMINSYVEPPRVDFLVEKLVHDCMNILLKLTFENKDMLYFYNKYELETEYELDKFIGTKLANYIFKGEKSEVIEEVLAITKERNSIEYKARKAMEEMYNEYSFNKKGEL